jgi:transposase-like protein
MEEETNNGLSRRSFDETFKRNAVALTLKGNRPIAQIAQELGIRDACCRRGGDSLRRKRCVVRRVVLPFRGIESL